MGFLLRDPSHDQRVEQGGLGHEERTRGAERRERDLRIPCSHKVFVECLENPVPHYRNWPYHRRLTMDGFISEFSLPGVVAR